MTLTPLVRTAGIVLVTLTLAASLTSCAALGRRINGEVPGAISNTKEEVQVSETPEATFAPQNVAPIKASSTTAAVEDTGLGVQWRILTVYQGNQGGAKFIIAMKNLNEQVAVPPAAIGTPKLTVAGKEIELMQVEDQGLDAPLGALSETKISYTFNTTPWNLSNAELTLGNAVFSGNLNI
ncbi:hypothetical protein WG915_10070 [Corynebacterium sp. H128]|uniref:hypothetical protein n=1 Tax=Corynebacterium sp. H128 TaxID=3133427 RepID=UPI0030AA1815